MSLWLLIWIYNYGHYTRRANTLFHSIAENEPSASFMISYWLRVSHSFFQINVTQWDFHQPVSPLLSLSLSLSLPHCLSLSLSLTRSLSSRCQVQWESLCCWMPSDTFQNNDNKLQARPSAVYPRSSHCRHTHWPQHTHTNNHHTHTHTRTHTHAHTRTHTHARTPCNMASKNNRRVESSNKKQWHFTLHFTKFHIKEYCVGEYRHCTLHLWSTTAVFCRCC